MKYAYYANNRSGKQGTGRVVITEDKGEVPTFKWDSFRERHIKCAACDAEITDYTNRSGAIYCSDTCRTQSRSLHRQARYQAVTHDSIDCSHCSESFTPKRSDSRFCSTKCRVAAHRLKAQIDGELK